MQVRAYRVKDYEALQIIGNEGEVDDDNDLGEPYFRRRARDGADWWLCYTRDGAGVFEYPGWTHTARRGEVVLLRPGTPEHFRRTADEPWNQMWVQFHPRPHWHEWLDWPVVSPGVMHLQVTDLRRRRRIEWLLHRCMKWMNRSSPHWQEYAMAAFEPVLLDLDAVNRNRRRGELDSRLLKAMDVLEQRLDRPVPLPWLAQAVGVSVPVLGRLFRNQLDTTPMRYLEDLRLARALDLLGHTTMTIKEVSEQLGFESPFYFTRRFTARLGSNPRAWRRELAVATAARRERTVDATELPPRPGRSAYSPVVGILVPPGALDVAYFRRLLAGVSETLARAGRGSLLVSVSGSAAAPDVDWLRPLLTDLDGLLALPGTAAAVEDVTQRRRREHLAACPAVTLLQRVPHGSSVTAKDATGAAAAARALLRLGHRHILHLACLPECPPPSGGPEPDARRAAIDRVLRQEGFEPTEYLHRYPCPDEWMDPDVARARLAARTASLAEERFVAWLLARPDITAILAGNDAVAIHAHVALAHAGLAVPGRYSLVGFDDTDPVPGPTGENRLSSVALPLEEIGRQGADMLLAMRTGSGRRRHRVLPATFVARTSLGPAPALARVGPCPVLK